MPRGRAVVGCDGVEPDWGLHLENEMCDGIQDKCGRIAGIECIQGLLHRTGLTLKCQHERFKLFVGAVAVTSDDNDHNDNQDDPSVKLTLICLSRQREQPVLCGTPTMVVNS